MITLVRHGQTPYNAVHRLQGQSDIPLSELGREQARELGERLKKENARFKALYCSKLGRAKETALIIGGFIGMTPTVLDGVEEINFGIFQGHTFAENAVLYPKEYEEHLKYGTDKNPHGGETGRMVFERARKAVLSVPDGSLIVCHGAVIGFLRSAVNGGGLSNVKEYIPGNAELIVFTDEELEKLRQYV